MKEMIFVIVLVGILFILNTFQGKQIYHINHINIVRKQYKILIKESSMIERIILFLFAVAINGGLIVYEIRSYQDVIYGKYLAIVLASIFWMVVLYAFIGIMMVSFERVQRLFVSGPTKPIRNRYVMGLLILILYLVLMACDEKIFSHPNLIHYFGAITSYYCHIYILIHISQEPLTVFDDGRISTDKEQRSILKTMLFITVVMIFFIVGCLFLGVFLVNATFPGAYRYVITDHPITILDLFYYTVISFTTIGYGEIVPVRPESKVMAVIIAFTSVLCLGILVSSIMELKGKFKK